MGKKIEELSDEELEALTPEELAELTAEQGRAEGEESEEESEEEQSEETEEESEEEGEGEGEGNGELTAEDLAELQALVGEGTEEEEDDNPDSEMVPRSRLNKVLEREADTRALARALLKTQGVAPAQQPAATTPVQEDPDPKPEFDFKTARAEYHKLVTEGEDEKALAKFEEIEEARDALQDWKLRRAKDEARAEAVQTITARETKKSVAGVMTALIAEFPFLNHETKDGNEAAILAVNAKARQLIQTKNMDPAEALKKAGESIGKTFAKVLMPKEKEAPAKPAGKKVTDGTDPRSKAALKRNLGVRQPATQKSGVGNRETEATLSIADLSDEQIDKLEKTNPALLRKLRGDDRIPT